MPVNQNSRYYGLPTYDAPDAQGKLHATIPMRLAPVTPTPPTVYQHTLVGLESIEDTSFGYFHASDAWWRIADANPLQFPLDWRPGTSVNLPALANQGQVVRSRRF
jgi:hypothetical protein